MHSLCIVVGQQTDDALAPFSCWVQVPKYRSYLERWEVGAMAERYGVPADDLLALAARLPEWHGSDGGIDEGRLFVWTTQNPDGKYDWYKVGGLFAGYFRLRQRPSPPWWMRLLGRRPTDRANRARKRDIIIDAVLADPPAAFLSEGIWHECPTRLERDGMGEWNARFAILFEKVPEDAVLSAVDVHS